MRTVLPDPGPAAPERRLGSRRAIAAVPPVILGLTLVLMAGCTPGAGSPGATKPAATAGGSAGSGQAASGAPPPTNAQAAAKAAVLAAYRAFWADVVAASHTADWQSPRLDDHAAGQPVTAVRDHLRDLQQAGLVDHGEIGLAPKVTALTATTARVSDCQDLTHFLKYDAKTGALRDRSSGKRYLAVATLTRIGGQWKVTQLAQAVKVCGTV